MTEKSNFTPINILDNDDINPRHKTEVVKPRLTKKYRKNNCCPEGQQLFYPSH
jgi:hypothetical protein